MTTDISPLIAAKAGLRRLGIRVRGARKWTSPTQTTQIFDDGDKFLLLSIHQDRWFLVESS
ncbi:hypothetical protein D3875_07840 [Deinococcus cavernae]|uniref:Uncharacterized protein n=1 Tax=Deinococcus cavernae TaxID=2320857 RepID=A0A418V5W0_9DEIO|nr:hypothetical protein D3875_07840 [Deinococcus cavernae]